MAVSVVNAKQTTGAAQGTLTIPSATAGNWLIMAVNKKTSVSSITGGDNISSSTGWLTNTNNTIMQSSTGSMWFMYKLAVGGETSLTPTANGGTLEGISYVEVSGLGIPLNIEIIQTKINNATNTTSTSKAITTTVNGDLVLGFIGLGNGIVSGTQNAWTGTGPMTNIGTATSSIIGGYYIAATTLSAATFTGNWTTTGTIGNIFLAIQPASSTGVSLLTGINNYYKLDDASGSTALDSVSANNGTWNGTLGSQWTTGIINGGGLFNGTNNYIVSGSNSGISGTNPISISCWFKTTNGTNSQGLLAVGASGIGLEFGLNIGGSNNLYLNFVGGGGVNSTAASTYSTGIWNHFVGIWNGSDQSTGTAIYLNNVYIPFTTVLTSANSITNGPIYIGSILGASSEWIIGDMDEVGVWDRVLTPSEVSALYNSGVGFQYPFGTGTINSNFLMFM